MYYLYLFLFDLWIGITSSEYFGAACLPAPSQTSNRSTPVCSCSTQHYSGIKTCTFYWLSISQIKHSPSLLYHIAILAHYLTMCIKKHFLYEIKTCYSDTGYCLLATELLLNKAVVISGVCIMNTLNSLNFLYRFTKLINPFHYEFDDLWKRCIITTIQQ